MLKKIKYLKSEYVMLLASFANINMKTLQYPENQQEYKYRDLLVDASQPENVNVEINVEEIIDKLMFENYAVYLKLKEKEKEFNESMMEASEFDDEFEPEQKKAMEGIKDAKKTVDKYIKLYEKLMYETKFEYVDIRSIQKFLLMERMQNEIKGENYEICLEIKKRIEEV